MQEKIFNTRTTDGKSDVFDHYGGRLSIFVWGGLGGGVVTVEVRTPDGSAWVPSSQETWTAPEIKVIELPPAKCRLSLDGATAATLEAQVSGF